MEWGRGAAWRPLNAQVSERVRVASRDCVVELAPEAGAPRFTVVAPGSSVGGVMAREFFEN